MGYVLRLLAGHLALMAYRRTEVLRRTLMISLTTALLGVGVLMLIESGIDDSYPGAGSLIIGAALLLPNAALVAAHRPPYVALIAAGCASLVLGAVRAAGVDVPLTALLLLVLGVIVLARALRPRRRAHYAERVPWPGAWGIGSRRWRP